MKTRKMNKFLGIFLALAMVFTTLFSAGVPTVNAADTKSEFKEGIYTGSSEKHVDAMKSDIRYDITLVMAEGNYDYTVELTVSGGMSHNVTENYKGQYTVDGNKITMTGELESAEVKAEGLAVTGKLSSFAGGNDTILLTYKEAVKPAPEFKDALTSGNYILTKESYDPSAMMKLPAYIVIDAEKDTFNIYPYTDGVADLATDKGSGTIAFDKETGVYTMTYETLESKKGQTSTFKLAEDGITFTSAMHYGGAKMNTLDEEGNFIQYTAKKLAAEKPDFEDALTSGNYVLTEDSYIASAMMKLPAYIVIDAEKDTFNIYPYKDGAADLATDKGSGTIAFDKKSGVYTMTYETLESKKGQISTFKLAEDGITFTSPMHYGTAKMNTLDENGEFAPYTAKKLAAEKPGFEDVLTSGNYVLTEDSYIASAMMKSEVYIVIDAEKDTFNLYSYKGKVADLSTDKGSGTIAFDKATGVYTMTYETLESKKGQTSTFTATENSITFTSPMHYGNAKMNTLDENGKFAPYTAKKLAAEKHEFTDVLVSGDYILTEESYIPTAFHKAQAYIVINAEKRTFNLYPHKDGVADFSQDKGSGMITFDKETGVYTMTYETLESKRGQTSTFTATENSITFTSPMHYGKAKMNTLDENGKFAPYTAKLVVEEKPEVPETEDNKGEDNKGEDNKGEDNKGEDNKVEDNKGEDTSVPKTGDNNSLMLMMTLLLLSVAGVIGATVLRKKSYR